MDAKVTSADIDAFTGLDGFHLTAAVAIGAVDPVIQPANQAVDPVLRIAFLEPGVKRYAFVCFAGALGVLGIEDVRSACHQNALAPRKDASRKTQVVEKNSRLGVLAVAICVLENLDAAARLALAVDTQRIITHVHDPELTVGAPGKSHLTLHHRLC